MMTVMRIVKIMITPRILRRERNRDPNRNPRLSTLQVSLKGHGYPVLTIPYFSWIVTPPLYKRNKGIVFSSRTEKHSMLFKISIKVRPKQSIFRSQNQTLDAYLLSKK